jgi:hypothetical protein
MDGIKIDRRHRTSFFLRCDHMSALVQQDECQPGCSAGESRPGPVNSGIDHNAGDKEYRPVNENVNPSNANDSS